MVNLLWIIFFKERYVDIYFYLYFGGGGLKVCFFCDCNFFFEYKGFKNMKIDGEKYLFLKENMVFLIINNGCWFGYWFKFESFYMCSELWVFVI